MVVDFLFAILFQTSELVRVSETTNVVETISDDIVRSCSAVLTQCRLTARQSQPQQN